MIKWLNKNWDCHDQVISLKKNTTKQLHQNLVSLKNKYIHTYINPQT